MLIARALGMHITNCGTFVDVHCSFVEVFGCGLHQFKESSHGCCKFLQGSGCFLDGPYLVVQVFGWPLVLCRPRVIGPSLAIQRD